jgi:hypothetical protein
MGCLRTREPVPVLPPGLSWDPVAQFVTFTSVLNIDVSRTIAHPVRQLVPQFVVVKEIELAEETTLRSATIHCAFDEKN